VRSLLVLFACFLFFFFFQAEDGIRDFHVTGVQTCALPIYTLPRTLARLFTSPASCCALKIWMSSSLTESAPKPSITARSSSSNRSEERRVGKECRDPWSPYP